jgi:hypothetical protein
MGEALYFNLLYIPITLNKISRYKQCDNRPTPQTKRNEKKTHKKFNFQKIITNKFIIIKHETLKMSLIKFITNNERKYKNTYKYCHH